MALCAALLLLVTASQVLATVAAKYECDHTVLGGDSTLFEAQTRVRSLLRQRRSAGPPVVVCLAPGRHDVANQTLAFEGDADSGLVTWRALAPGAVVNGGIQLTGWSATSLGGGAAFVTSLPSASFSADSVVRTLWVAGRRASRATVTNVSALLGKMTPWHSADSAAVGYVVAGDTIPLAWRLNNTRRIEFVWPIVIANWIEPRCCVGSITGNNITLLAPCGQYLLARNVYASTLSPPISAEAVPAFPLAPGTFYHDAENNALYYTLADGENEASLQADAWVSAQDVLVSYTNVTGHTWEGIEFSYGTWGQAHSADGFVDAQSAVFACTVGTPNCMMGNRIQRLRGASALSRAASAAGQGEPRGNIRVSRSSGIIFTGCNFTHLGAPYALSIMEGSRNVSITRCTFSDLSGGFLKLGSVSDTPAGSTNKSTWDAGLSVTDNTAGGMAQEYQGAAAYFGGYISDSVLSHNDIDSSGYSGVSLGWGWGADFPPGYGKNTISYNKITHVMTKLRDGGGIYVNGATNNDTSSLMSRNWVNADEAVFAVFYLDNGASECGSV